MSKKNLILGGVLALLVVIAWAYQGPWQDLKEKRLQTDNFLSDLDIGRIGRIEVSRNDETVSFAKVDDRWKIEGTKDFWLKDDLSAQIISSLTDAKEKEMELASQNAEKKSEFLTDESGTEVKLMQGDEILYDFFVGKNTPDFQGTYLSLKDSGETYSVKAGLNQAFDRDDWRDKAIFSSEREKISKLRFQYPDRSFTLEKSQEGEEAESSWSGVEPYSFSVSEDKIEKVLDIMSNLNAAKIPEQSFEGTGLEKHSIIVQASGEGIDNILMVGDAAEAQDGGENGREEALYYAKKGNSDNIYLIFEEERQELDKQIWQLR